MADALEIPVFRDRLDYQAPLLQLLAEAFPQGGSEHDVCQAFYRRYRSNIPRDHLLIGPNGQPFWRRHVVFMASERLTRRGLLEGYAANKWMITEDGRRWLAEHMQPDVEPQEEAPSEEIPRTSVQRPVEARDSRVQIAASPDAAVAASSPLPVAMPEFDSHSDYKAPLLLLLVEEFPSGGAPRIIQERFYQRFLNRIPEHHRQQTGAGGLRWRQHLYNATYDLVAQRYIDRSIRGLWRVTDEGRKWLQGQPAQAYPAASSRPSPAAKTVAPSSDADYGTLLLRLLSSELPEGGLREGILRRFGEVYAAILPRQDLRESADGSTPWVTRLHETVRRLVSQGLMDGPMYGWWSITEAGKEWLARHPAAGSTRAESLTQPRVGTGRLDAGVSQPRMERDEFLSQFRQRLEEKLASKAAACEVLHEAGKNHTRAKFPAFGGSVYFLTLYRNRFEVGLYFYTSLNQVDMRLAAFAPHTDSLSEQLQRTVVAERIGGGRYGRVRMDLEASVLSAQALEEQVDVFVRFVDATMPILEDVHRPRRTPRPKLVDAGTNAGVQAIGPQHAILDRQIAEIQDFLRGRLTRRPTDEKLCDWVCFCYTFELFREAAEIFKLIDSTQVNAWYYDRAKRLAKVCAMK